MHSGRLAQRESACFTRIQAEALCVPYWSPERKRFSYVLSFVDAISSGLPTTWFDLAAIDTVLEVSEELGGEDPLLPELRTVSTARRRHEDLRASMASTTGEEIQLPEADEEAIARVRGLVYRELDILTLTI